MGFSRIIDVLISEKAAGRNNIIDPTAVGVTGCSRNGKGAFTVGAFDERIALGIPQESGTGGVSAFRIVNTNPVGPNGNPAQSRTPWRPCTHRGGCWSSTTRGSASCARPASTRPPTRPRWCTRRSASGRTSATTAATRPTRRTTARSTRRPRVPPLQRAIRGHLTRTAAPDGRMEPQPAGTADLAKWVPWSSSAPTLTNDVSWASPPSTSQ
jgi:hypothetical protein